MTGLTLGIDTTGPICSLALVRGSEVTASLVDPAIGTAEQFLPRLQALLQSIGTELGAIERIAVCSGPGSFTGIRTGFASAQGLSFARQIPVLGVSSLLCRLFLHIHAMPHETMERFVPMISAREGEFYGCELLVVRARDGSFSMTVERAVGVSAASELSGRETMLDEPGGAGGAALAAASFDLAVSLLGRGDVGGLCQLCEGGLGLLPLYIKPVNAKTLEERFANEGA